jgi:hypothetical protein
LFELNKVDVVKTKTSLIKKMEKQKVSIASGHLCQKIRDKNEYNISPVDGGDK